jgi:hypothetical protein
MNFKSLIAVGFGIATVALTLPARADQATVIQVGQDAVTTGNRNITTQRNTTGVANISVGNRDSQGTSVGVSQRSDTFGKGNVTRQENNTSVGNVRIRNKY